MYHPLPSSATDETESKEFLELYNSGNEILHLGGYHFDRGITYTFPANATLSPKSYLLLIKDAESFLELTNPISTFVEFTGSLSNSGETLRLKDALEQTVGSMR